MKPTSKSILIMGILDSLPICLSFFFMFASLGASCNTINLSNLNSVLMTILIFAAPLQIALLFALQHHHIGVLDVVLLAFVVNFRFMLNSIAILPHLGKHSYSKLLLAMFIFSASSFTVTYTKYKSCEIDEKDNLTYFYGVAIPSYMVAILATLVGYLFLKIHNNVPVSLIFTMVLPLHFAALIAKRYPNIMAIFTAIMGFIITPFILDYSSFINVAIAILVGIIAVLYERKNT